MMLISYGLLVIGAV